jgi:polyhydroxyalkanoate synthesis regulator phasin
MSKDPEEYEDIPRELARVDQNIEGLLNKFERQSQMLVRVDQLEERVERLERQLSFINNHD